MAKEITFETPPTLPEGYGGTRWRCAGPRVQGEMRRMGCGNDMTARVLAVPQDGEVYAIECPVCGSATTIRRTPEEKK